jgi:hypothetical protein
VLDPGVVEARWSGVLQGGERAGAPVWKKSSAKNGSSWCFDGTSGIVAPDNVDVNRHGQLAILEDPAHDLKELGLARDASVWMYDLHAARLDRIATIDRKAAIRHALRANPANTNDPKSDGPGRWETSGIVDAEALLGRGAWLLSVQAHSLRIDPVAETVQGGQLLWLRWR